MVCILGSRLLSGLSGYGPVYLGVSAVQKRDAESGKRQKVVIKANNNGEANRYISSMKVNGKNYTKNYLIHGDLMRGMNILYNMSATPNKSRGTQDSDAPYSFSNELGK